MVLKKFTDGRNLSDKLSQLNLRNITDGEQRSSQKQVVASPQELGSPLDLCIQLIGDIR